MPKGKDTVGSFRHSLTKILQMADNQQLTAIGNWARDLVVIEQHEGLTRRKKFKSAFKSVINAGKDLFPVMEKLLREFKRHGWDERSLSARWAIGAIGIALTTVGTTTFGLAGFGTAVAVSSVIVFGAGGALIGTLHQEILNEMKKRDMPTTEYEVKSAVEPKQGRLIEGKKIVAGNQDNQ